MNKLLNQPIDEDKPGAGQHYCVTCARYFIAQYALDAHYKTKEHKKRFKVCKDEPYTLDEAQRAGGIFKPTKENPGRLAALVDGKMDI